MTTTKETASPNAVDTDQALDAILAKYLDVINEKLPGYIEDAGLDPWEEVASGKETLGKINLGVCTAKAKAKYNIKNMKGLSSLEIDSLEVEESSGEEKITGTAKMSAELDSNLSAKVSGSVSAECEVLGVKASEKVEISGKVTAKDVTGKGKASFTAEVSGGSICLTELKLTSLSLDYKDIKVEIDGLGIFNSLLDPLVDLIDDIFGDAIKGEVANALKPVLNDLLESELPYCD